MRNTKKSLQHGVRIITTSLNIEPKINHIRTHHVTTQAFKDKSSMKPYFYIFKHPLYPKTKPNIIEGITS